MEGSTKAHVEKYDLFVLDIMLPGRSSLEITRDLRTEESTAPIHLLTVRDRNDDIVAGLDAGADDYLTKPFSLDEVLARIRALLRRGGARRPDRLLYDDVELDRVRHEARRGGVMIDLSPLSIVLAPALTLLLAVGTPGCASAQGAPAMDSTMTHAMPTTTNTMVGADQMIMLPGPLGISRGREGSGTSWLPDATPMAAVHFMAGPWELMVHGNVFVQYIDQGSDRGDSQFGSINWLMGMARRSWAGGDLGFRAMMSAEPFTIPGCGYPILLATGELCHGEPIHDAQHPHDLFMELAAQYQRSITDHVAVQLYGGPAGEPALGPVAFPHRPSALSNPLAPVSHHSFDATHVSFGVVTGGLYGRRWKVEGSLFNGREPDEDRLGIDLASLDSYSGRVWVVPSDRWAIQVSAGRLNDAEPGHEPGGPGVDVARYTTSATYYRPRAAGGSWATTAGLGHNVEQGRATDALLLETSLDVRGRHLVFGRAEWAEKSGEDLVVDEDPTAFSSEMGRLQAVARTYDVGTLALGYTRRFAPHHGWVPGLGARASLNFVPADLERVYGQGNPVGSAFTVFLSFRPTATGMASETSPGMTSKPMPGMPGM
ncbi:MAG: response regulator transcription factor [Gemmatimonadetes bacterium]|nr:response regulator transcription factor [Gemmatimonadota bacterium]